MKNLHYSFMGYIPCYTQEKGWDLRKNAQNDQKVLFWGQDDVITSKWLKIC